MLRLLVLFAKQHVHIALFAFSLVQIEVAQRVFGRRRLKVVETTADLDDIAIVETANDKL